MKNFEIKWSQLGFNTATKIIFVNYAPLCVKWAVFFFQNRVRMFGNFTIYPEHSLNNKTNQLADHS